MIKNLELADKVEDFSYMKPFTEDEMQAMRVELVDNSIKLKGKQEELKEIKDSFKEEMKPLQDGVSSLLKNLHHKAEFVTEKCGVEFDQKKQVAIYYNSEGVEVGKRPLSSDERQSSIFTEMRKTGTYE